jgi:transposase
MDTSTQVGSSTRQFRTLEEKLSIVREASAPGASVASVARKHGVNANLVFGWRRLHQRGLLEGQRHARSVPLLPVKITTPTVLPDRASRPVGEARTAKRESTGYVVVEFPGEIAVRIHGRVDRAALAIVFAALRVR